MVPKKHGLFPGVIAEGSVAALSPQSRILKSLFAVSQVGTHKNPRAEHTAKTPPRGVDTRRGRFDDTDQHGTARPFTPSIRVQTGRQTTALEVRQYDHRTTRHRRHAKITDEPTMLLVQLTPRKGHRWTRPEENSAYRHTACHPTAQGA